MLCFIRLQKKVNICKVKTIFGCRLFAIQSAMNITKAPAKRDPNVNVKVYVQYHKQAMFKGMDIILGVLEDLQEEGHKIDIITPENATEFWPDS